MTDQLISFETAKLAKEKGFNEVCKYMYNILNERNREVTNREGYLSETKYWISAPTQSLLQKWLREMHKIYINPSFNLGVKEYGGWTLNCTILDYSAHSLGIEIRHRFEEIYYEEEKTFFSYEEALEIGLQEALKLIK